MPQSSHRTRHLFNFFILSTWLGAKVGLALPCPAIRWRYPRSCLLRARLQEDSAHAQRSLGRSRIRGERKAAARIKRNGRGCSRRLMHAVSK